MDEHVQPLLEDDNPSWVTLPNDENNNGGSKQKTKALSSNSSVGSSPWDQAAARLKETKPDISNSWANDPTSNSGNNGEEQDNEDDLPRIVLLMRLGNMGAASLLIFGSVGSITKIFSLSKMVLGGYGIIFGTLVCCLEINLSFLRHPIASNFGFLYNPFLRLLFYILMGMVSWSFDTVLGMIASVALGALAVVNTWVLCRYPGYRKVLNELGEEEEKKMKREGMKQLWMNGDAFKSLPWWEV
mmetsp:Transcript_10688/g.22663  ORF Transcript_10688/g.22663 Transcript_10688/m.22663 type:complete len:243 (-) Transcript_10688:177-905(-)|eukprot:CAMPEP_0196133856 /NCGR_PEP_ID=MMETSP0910-20130528/2895_1 /TAXON_ID=49265 /ORGANISM="Thalassiosira rotula, Strain GSO102" /LENGTH=242 /DNA_ID=CAMNT_0041393611 /DNA_START=148 /DNA_END=876 /DNA_ORIENTATION=+